MDSRLRTTLLLAVLTVLIIWIGGQFGGRNGMVIAFVFAVVMNFGSYWFSDKIVLSMYRAQPLDEQQAPQLYRMVRELAAEANIPMPRLYLIPDGTPNAFATGRNPENAVVAVTEGLVRLLTPEEVRGVIAHEIGHVKNRDILVSSIAATLAGVVMMLANMAKWTAIFGGFRGGSDENSGGGALGLIVTAIVAPIAAMLIQFAISRSREYLADETGARLAHNPESLARALEKLSVASERIPMEDAKPATAHMFIVNPLTGRSLANLFSTHPPIEERVRRLRSM
ncbi:MAG: zinc metalloprotease HtpX [Syntrophobacteraceae bacterium]|nr:zinc metalloprotease HtpX [Syntrophobacteraceae bacterium]